MTIRSATLQFWKRIALVAAPSKASTLITTIIIALSRVAQIAPTQIEIKAIAAIPELAPYASNYPVRGKWNVNDDCCPRTEVSRKCVF